MIALDRYTKGVLTVIAGALVYICLMVSGPRVAAQSGPAPFTSKQLTDVRPQPVVVVGWGTLGADGEIRVTTVKQPDGSVRTDPFLPIKVREMPPSPLSVSLGFSAEHPLPVGLTAVTPGAAWEPIRAKVEPAPTQKYPGQGRP